MDDQTKQNKSISEQIITAARSGKLKMRPKWQFILRASLWLVGLAAVLLALLYLFSLFLFITRRTGVWIAPIFGFHGILIFLTSLPWLLVLAVLVFVVILEILVRRYYFAYRLPLLYSALGVLLVVVAGGIVLAGTPLHDILSHCPRPGNLPPAGLGRIGGPPCGTGIYRDLDPQRLENIHRGVISDFDGGNFILTDNQQEALHIIITRKTRLPFGDDFTVGDMVVVVGDRHGDQVEAFGISRVDNQ
jgi:hypothetical protein